MNLQDSLQLSGCRPLRMNWCNWVSAVRVDEEEQRSNWVVKLGEQVRTLHRVWECFISDAFETPESLTSHQNPVWTLSQHQLIISNPLRFYFVCLSLRATVAYSHISLYTRIQIISCALNMNDCSNVSSSKSEVCLCFGLSQMGFF